MRTDAWILGNHNQRIQSPIQDNSIQMVVDLIDPITRKWMEDVIHSTFDEEDSRRILAIPLPHVPHKDFQAWSGEETREYTVHSAYKWLLHNRHEIYTDGNSYPYTNLYKRLWNLDQPSKMNITTWRIINNFLPTYANLNYRRFTSLTNCPQCHNGIEMVEHVF